MQFLSSVFIGVITVRRCLMILMPGGSAGGGMGTAGNDWTLI